MVKQLINDIEIHDFSIIRNFTQDEHNFIIKILTKNLKYLKLIRIQHILFNIYKQSVEQIQTQHINI